MKIVPTSMYALKEPSFPVIRIDYKGRILYANKASFPLLKEWNCLANDYIPDQLVKEIPAMLDLNADFDFKISTNDSLYYMDVIGFKESGYVGLYGFRTEINLNQRSPKKNYAIQY